MIVRTDASCIIGGISWPGIPTLVWPEGIDEDVSDYLRHCRVTLGQAESSTYELAKLLRPFLRFCRERGRPWRTIDDGLLVIWREEQRRGRNVSTARINASLYAAFGFLRWAEETGRIRFVVGIYEQADVPPELRAFPVSAKRISRPGKRPSHFSGWTTPLLLRTVGARPRHTPTDAEAKLLHEKTAERRYAERDSLVLSWAEETGARRGDIGQLGKSHLPTLDEIDDLLERDDDWEILLVRKGGAVKPLRAGPHLILRTIDHVDRERRAMVQTKLHLIGYVEPDEIFISEDTGMPLHLDSITSLSRSVFRTAGVRRASLHRLRAKRCVEVVETLIDGVLGDDSVKTFNPAFAETILVKAAEMMGHSSTESLRPYLTFVLNRRLTSSEAMKSLSANSKARQMRLHADAIAARMTDLPDLQRVADLIRTGDEETAAVRLAALLEKMTGRPIQNG